MKREFIRWGLVAGFAAVSAVGAFAQQATQQGSVGDGLIDALVKKGVLTYQEAEDIRTDMQNEYKATPGGFLSVGSPAVTGLRLYGDARLRYQYNNIQTMNGTPNHDQDRYRYRLRIGADYTFAENWKAGVRLETASKSDSTNQDFGGYFSKDGDSIYVGLAYLEYETKTPEFFGNSFADYFDMRAGKQLQPFTLNDMLWDPDINPEGFSEQIGWSDVFVDGLGVTLRGGEYITSNAKNDTGYQNTGGTKGSDQFLFVAQAEAKYNFDKNTSLVVAPAFIKETNGLATSANQDGGAVFDKQNNIPFVGNIDVITIPVQFGWKMWDLPNKAYGSWGYNFSADDWAYQVGLTHGGGNQIWNLGYQLGNASKKGTWQVGLEWRYVEAGSYSTWLQDSDWAASYQNQQGPALSAKYAFTDNIVGGITWFHSSPIKDNSGVTPVNGVTASGGANIGVTDMVQVDLNWKF